ncbi:gliding motility lipoprotein GldH [Flavobacterium cyanobacteriorum]|uniref:Gliding motility lipoprotein GldH n=1 Tax=Flavobacterium cyanobacteriorum TaxID=2022802 RepID=A0A255ZQI4_9FLAO|nr:gliding motility lipoprotein GldH [Flavobacterium cyanobacteriorum]OYQ43753.1 gliding motility lipoprotein GldH [Flavobacterium cyanobacteriorum]
MPKKNSILITVVALFLFCSCDNKRVFDEYKALNGKWNKDSIVSFETEFKDTASKYNLFINIRNNNSYPYSNLFLIVQMQQPGTNITKVDTLEYQMAYPDGTLMGEGFTDVKENKLWYKENVSFPKPGKYRFSIQQAMRRTGKVPGVQELEGITDVGLRIESTK